MQIAFVSCTRKKKDYPCSAENLYSASALFRKAFSFGKDRYDKVYIVSAKYGLLKPDEEIEPYGHQCKRRNGQNSYTDNFAMRWKDMAGNGKRQSLSFMQERNIESF
ncbi:MAG: DUF6884 domain-containing protein [Thermoactinomyces sp.]